MLPLHEGPDRIQFSPTFGRPMRAGSWDQLSVSDSERVLTLLDQSDWEQATGYLGYFAFGHKLMLDIGLEWPLHWAEFIRQQDAGRVDELVEQCHEAMKASLSDPERSPASAVLALVGLGDLDSAALARRKDGADLRIDALMGAPQRHLDACLAAVGEHNAEGAKSAFLAYFDLVRHYHNLLFRFGWALSSAVSRAFGQAAGERGLQETLVACSFYEVAWANSDKLSPEETVVMLSEHLRGHFSGPNQEGAVRIVEEDDRIRIEADACGSGGYMRRRLGHDQAGFEVFSEASPVTWGQTGVPTYCAHCAINELESIRRLGRPLWVTEFQADPGKRCGWTVFRDPKRIPEELYSRLGHRRPTPST